MNVINLLLGFLVVMFLLLYILFGVYFVGFIVEEIREKDNSIFHKIKDALDVFLF